VDATLDDLELLAFGYITDPNRHAFQLGFDFTAEQFFS
jgi:hypothetical protein